jgi:hypothetical protein
VWRRYEPVDEDPGRDDQWEEYAVVEDEDGDKEPGVPAGIDVGSPAAPSSAYPMAARPSTARVIRAVFIGWPP